MIDPVEVQQIAAAAILSGGIVFFGTAYAIFYALGRLRLEFRFLSIAYGCYGALCLSTVGVMNVLHLTGWWLTLVGALLLGYFIAPRFIWRLSVEVHEIADRESGELEVSADASPWR